MALPEFDGFSLQDDNYITSNIEYRTIPNRSTNVGKLARRPGTKLIAHDFAERRVRLSGSIVASSNSELQTLIDNLHKNVTRKDEGILTIESDRTATAVVTNVVIADPGYTNDYVPFEMEFLMPDPFYYGNEQTIEITVVSGTSSINETITISGSYAAEPTIKFFADGTTGQTTLSGILIDYGPTGERLTWSGTGATTTLAYGGSVTFDYFNQQILESGIAVDIEGVFVNWEPEETNYTVTFSGTTQGGTLQFSYQPRYL